MQDWEVDDVCNFLEGLQLQSLVTEFKQNAVDGADLLSLDDTELAGDLHCTNLQIKKIRASLQSIQAGGPVPAAATTAAAATLAPAAVQKQPQQQQQQQQQPEFLPADLAQYKTLATKIAELEGRNVDAAAAAARHHLKQAVAQRAAAHERLPVAEAAKAKAEKSVEKLEGWYPAKLIFGEKKREAKRDTKEKEQEAATAAAVAAAKAVEAADAAAAAAQKQANDLTVQLEELNATRGKRTALVAFIFNNPVWAADPTISALRYSIQDLSRQAAETASHEGTYARGRDLLVRSREKINEALQALRRTRFMGVMGMGMGGPGMGRGRGIGGGGNMMMSMAEMMSVRRADDLIKSAAEDYTAAKQILPALPFKNEACISAARTGVFIGMLTPGLGGDIMQQVMIRKSMATVQEMQNGVQECLAWAGQNLNAFSVTKSQLNANMMQKNGELVAYEHSLLDAAVVAK